LHWLLWHKHDLLKPLVRYHILSCDLEEWF
jgi:hypothetical protein